MHQGGAYDHENDYPESSLSSTAMIRTILWYIFFWAYQIVSLSFFIPLLFFRVFGMKDRETAWVLRVTGAWARSMIRAAGATVAVRGLDNIPGDGRYCIIANHQGGFDIPLLIGIMPVSVGFIAKKELRYIPVLSTWMKAINCVFLDRSNRRTAAASIKQAVEQVKNGEPLIIFPEGTRSRSREMGTFKSGSMKVPIRARVAILPVTIDGSYLLKEANSGLIQPASVTVTVHEPIDAGAYRNDQTQELNERVTQTIAAPLKH